MSLVKINWHPNREELRKFGLTVLIGFLIIGGVFFVKKPATAYWVWGLGVAMGISGLTGLKIALPFYWAWMGIAFVMGNVMSRVFMSAIFACVITPLAIFIRLIGRDRLNLRRSDKNSYWTDIKPHRSNRKSYERQF
jgi:hypothetical protein